MFDLCLFVFESVVRRGRIYVALYSYMGTKTRTQTTRVTPFPSGHLHNYETGPKYQISGEGAPAEKQKTPFFYAPLTNGTLHMSMSMTMSVSMSWMELAWMKAKGSGAAELQSQSQSVTPIRKAGCETKGLTACGLEMEA